MRRYFEKIMIIKIFNKENLRKESSDSTVQERRKVYFPKVLDGNFAI